MDKHELEHLATLCRIHCSEADLEKFSQDISKILSYIDQLKELPTEGIEPCYQVIDSAVPFYRKDEVKDLLSREQFLANAPAQVGGMIKVPPVLKA